MYKGDAMLDQMVEICGIEWTTKSGETIKIVDMTDDHVVNAVRYLRHRYGTQLDEEIEDLGESDTVPTFPAVLAEAEKRGLQP